MDPGSTPHRRLAPPENRRHLGRSRHYTPADLPERLRRWHAPRANRWELVCVDVGALDLQWLDASGVTTECLHAGDSRWIAPGMRWRVARLDPGARFQLEIHADDAAPASAPQALRAALIDEVACVQLDDDAACRRLLADLAPGERRLARGGFDFSTPLRAAMAASGQTLFWHPLEIGSATCTALIARAAQPARLLEYLGRDHAVIEAVLAGALRGDTEHGGWLRNSLSRHLAIEEDLLFPAYLRAGGNPGWVSGLCNEHEQLRQHLEQLAEPFSQRRFLLLLDGHDEKEEQIVYPDILARLAPQASALTTTIMAYPLVAADGRHAGSTTHSA